MRTPEEIYARYAYLADGKKLVDEHYGQAIALKWALGDDFDRLDRKPLPKGIIYNPTHNIVAQWIAGEYSTTDSDQYSEEELIATYNSVWVELVPKPTSDEPRSTL